MCEKRDRILLLSSIAAIFLAAASPAAAADLAELRTGAESVRTILSAKDLGRVLEDVRGVDASVYSPVLDRTLSQWSTPLTIGEVTYYPLRYSNPEIVDIVIRAYIGVVERERAYIAALRGDGAIPEFVAPIAPLDHGESVAEFHDLLADMAESTLSDSLYPYIWDYPQPSSFRTLYLAHVRPASTIDRFAGAGLGREVNGSYVAEDSLCVDGDILCTSLVDAFDILSGIVSVNPELGLEHQPSLIRLIRDFGLHYSSSNTESYLPTRDYRVRRSCIEILTVVGNAEHLRLLEELTVASPESESLRRVADPTDLSIQAQQAAEALRTR